MYLTNFASVSAAAHWWSLSAVDQTVEVLTSCCSIYKLLPMTDAVHEVEGVFTLLSFSQIIPANAEKNVFADGTIVSRKWDAVMGVLTGSWMIVGD